MSGFARTTADCSGVTFPTEVEVITQNMRRLAPPHSWLAKEQFCGSTWAGSPPSGLPPQSAAPDADRQSWQTQAAVSTNGSKKSPPLSLG